MNRVEISMSVQLRGWHYDEIGLVPPLVRPRVEPSATIHSHGFEAHEIVVPSAGACTYLETSGHLVPNGPRLVALKGGDLVFPISLMRLGTVPEGHIVCAADLDRAARGLNVRGALIIDTGWERQVGAPGYVEACPRFHADTAAWLMARTFDLLAVDVPVLEATAARGKILEPLFRNKQILLLAPVVNLGLLSGQEATLIALPIAIDVVSGAPCRALVLDGLPFESVC